MTETEVEDRLKRAFSSEDWARLALDSADAKEALIALEVVTRLLSRAHRRLAAEAPSTARELVRAAVEEINEAYPRLVRSQTLSDQIAREASARVEIHMREVNRAVDLDSQGMEVIRGGVHR